MLRRGLNRVHPDDDMMSHRNDDMINDVLRNDGIGERE
jgi:hypothetical protein